MHILLASPHGFCAGVVRAIRTLESAIDLYGPPIYVLHEIVHNKHVVQQFRDQGVTFVDTVDGVPDGALLLFSAQGVSPQVRLQAAQRLRTIDATCPLVAKVHTEAARLARLDYTIFLVGHADHDEVVGTMGEAPQRIILIEDEQQAASVQIADPERLAYLTQTTLSIDDAERIIRILRQRFPRIVGPSTQDICYATQNRQEAVRDVAGQADLVLVVGSRNSSNSIRLVEVSREAGTPAYLIDAVTEIDRRWLENVATVVVTAGASAPEHLVWECIGWLQKEYQASFEHRSIRDEDVEFRLPNLLVQLDLDGSRSACSTMDMPQPSAF